MKQILILLEQGSGEHPHLDTSQKPSNSSSPAGRGTLEVQEAHLHSLHRDIFLPTMKNPKEPGLRKNVAIKRCISQQCLLCSHKSFILTPLPFPLEAPWPREIPLAGVAKGSGDALSCWSAQKRCGKKSVSKISHCFPWHFPGRTDKFPFNFLVVNSRASQPQEPRDYTPGCTGKHRTLDTARTQAEICFAVLTHRLGSA